MSGDHKARTELAKVEYAIALATSDAADLVEPVAARAAKLTAIPLSWVAVKELKLSY